MRVEDRTGQQGRACDRLNNPDARFVVRALATKADLWKMGLF